MNSHSSILSSLRAPAALIFLFVAMVLANRLDWINPQSFVFVPLELWLFGLLLLVPGAAGRGLCNLLGLVVGVALILRLADIATFQVFARRFNPVYDYHLLHDGVKLLVGTIGYFGAGAVVLLLAALGLGIFWLSVKALAVLQTSLAQRRRPALLWLSLALVASVGWRLSGLPRTTTWFSDQLHEHAVQVVASLRDLRDFRAELTRDPAVGLPTTVLFDALAGKDLAVIFVESYGRAALDQEPFAARVNTVLAEGEAALGSAGFGMRSAWLQSPTVGGLSWLAHATALSGLWIDSQLRHDSLMISEWPSLNRLFQRAGWRTVALMPAITMPWPESAWYGYDQLYAAADLGYRGQPYNWVTMPDQYVLSSFERLERGPRPRPPVMAEIALISSHAPWTPIATVVPWDAVGDGTVFNAQASAGPTPEEVWSDNASIRAHYRDAVSYALDDLVSWLLHYGDDDLVVLILGDHQPAPLVSGDSENREVPVHLIAHDPAVLDAVAAWGWTEGLRPDTDAPSWRMDALRGRMVEAFSPGTTISLLP